jgi:hypothetical protein
VEVDDVDGYDMPMSIYSQYFITLVSKLLRSKFQVSFQISKRFIEGFKFGPEVLLLHPVCLHHPLLHGPGHLLVLPPVGGGYVNSDNDS